MPRPHLRPWKKTWARKLRLAYLRQLPRLKTMRGGLVHRLLGERVFDGRLWKPSRETFAGGLALGLIIGLLPTFSLHIILAFVFSYLLRVNLTAAVLGTLVTNPLTTPPIMVLQYRLGVWMVGAPDPDELARYHGMLKFLMGHARPFMAGSVVSALLCGLAGYLAVILSWDGVVKLRRRRAAP